METEQTSVNQNLMETQTQPQQISSSNSKLFVIVASSVLLTAVVAGSVVYFWQKSANEKAISSLEQKISSLEEHVSTITPTTESSPSTNPFANWKTYKKGDVGLEFKYPPEFSIKEGENSLTIYSLQYQCRVKGTEDKFNETSEITINLALHQGRNFEEIWLNTFGFPFTGENSYDGIETINSKRAYYFYQGAEMSFGRKAYLIKLNQTKALEVNIFTPIYTFECKGQVQEFSQSSSYTMLTNQILTTFKFTN